MRKIRKWKGGEKMRTLTRNKKRVDYVDYGGLTQEQMDQLIPILEEIKYRREHGLEEYYTLEEAMQELDKALEEE